jgi:capsular polysaccharide transport system permease protein
MTSLSRARRPFLDGLAVQSRVVGALVMREVHTRYGRNNIGYLWLVAEPGLLATGVAVIHYVQKFIMPWGMDVAPFYICGYTAFMMFRNCCNRAGSTLAANGGLLYHRMVTISDGLLARAILEGVGTFLSFVLLLSIITVFQLGGHMPDRWHYIFLGWALNFWYCYSASLLCCAGCAWWDSLDRFIHPALYFALPVSGIFFIFAWLQPELKVFVIWFPMPHIIEIIREGEFGGFNSVDASPIYVASCSAIMTLLGLLAIRVARRHVEI